MAWDDAVVTNGGVALLREVISGNALVLDNAAGGTGVVPAVALMAQTALATQKQTFPIVSSTVVGNGKKVKIQITNTTLTTGYTLNQIGIWAHIGNNPSVLFAILQDAAGMPIPANTEITDFTMSLYAVIDFSNAGKFSLTVDTSTLVTTGTLNEALACKLSTTGDAKDLSVTFLEGDKVNIATGDKLSAVMGKLSRWFASFGAAAWLGVGTAVNTVAAGDHGHAFADISDKPASYAPAAHKSTHFVGGADALVPADIGAAITLSGTATLTTAGWTGTAAPFVYELSAPGVSDSDAPLIDYVGGADAAAAELIKAGWLIAVSSYVKPMATAGKITFKAKEKPTVKTR